MMDYRTKTDLRRAPFVPRDSKPHPAPTGDEEQALLFGETGNEAEVDSAPRPARPDEDATAD